MIKILHEIRQQPIHIRHLFMWTSVVITFSLVAFIGFNSTKNNVVALLNPENEHGTKRAKGSEQLYSPYSETRKVRIPSELRNIL